MPDRIRLSPNQPITVKLVDPYADSCELYDAERQIGEYRTMDGRMLALPRPAVLKLNELAPQPGEEIGIARYDRKNGTRGVEWAVWLTAESEKARADAGSTEDESPEPSDTEVLLQASIEQAGRRRRGKVAPIRKQPDTATEPIQPRLFDKGTGTDGPAPAIQPAARIPLPAAAKERVKYGDALRHIVRTVKRVTTEENLPLGDGPMERLIVTVFIDAAKYKKVDYDFTEAE